MTTTRPHIEIRCTCKKTICQCMCLNPKKIEIRDHPARQDQAAIVAWGQSK